MKAMILAAGRGERMRPLTDRLPKPLLPVAGKPLIERLVARLVSCGIADIVINVSHLGELIERTLGDGTALGARIAYSREQEALETAGGIAAALPFLGHAPFVVVNGDVYSDFHFGRLVQRAAALSEAGVLAHLVLVDNPPHHPVGDFCLEQGLLVDRDSGRLTFSGIGIYHPALFLPVPAGTRHPLASLLRGPIAARRISGEHHTGLWMDIGTPERLTRLERLLADRASTQAR